MYIERFAWLPTVIKVTGSKNALIWLQYYQLKKYQNFPTLCDCEQYPCSHTTYNKGFYKMPANYKKLGVLTLEWWV